MKKVLFMSLVIVTLLHASKIEDALANGATSAELRLAYNAIDYSIGHDDYATAFGGIVKYETKPWHDVSFGVGAYISQKVGFASGRMQDSNLNVELLDANGESYAYVGEAYLNYSAHNFSFRIGRQLIDTPFADTDDIRMHPNSFEAAIATYTLLEKTTFVGGYIRRWAGYDSEDTLSKDVYKKLAHESKGAIVAGVMDESIENLAINGWYYSVDNVADFYYADSTYILAFNDDIALEVAAQYARFNEKKDATGRDSNIDGTLYGFSMACNLAGVSLGAAYNLGKNDNDKTPPIGFGGGPYMTSMEEWTIEGMNDIKAYQLGLEVDMALVGAEGVTLSSLYGDFRSKSENIKVQELDFIASMEFGDSFIGDISYAKIEDRKKNADGGSDAGYERILARVHYFF